MKKLILLLHLIIPSLIFGQIAGYEYQNIQGFEVYVELDAVDNYPQETNEAIVLLTSKLTEINEFELVDEIIDSLHSVKIFVDWNTTNGAAVYHPSLQWLIDNGYIPEKWKSVEISNITNFLSWTQLNQPSMVMHELAHAYHHRELGYSYMPIIESYDNAMQNHLYDWVSYHAGNGVYFDQEAYATTNEKEYFSELTEAYLGENDYYPFIREELEIHDPMGYNLVADIWQFENVMSISSHNNLTFAIYPNPVTDVLYIESQQPFETVKTYNLQGQLIKEDTTSSVDVSQLRTGLYFIQVTVDGKTVTKEFVKE